MDNAHLKRDWLSLPEKAKDTIFKHLGPVEFLSLRRTCKTTKAWVESYSGQENNSHMLKKFEKFRILLQDNNLTFIDELIAGKMTNLTNFHINNTHLQYLTYRRKEFYTFNEIYSKQISILKIETYSDCRSVWEFNFFSSLTNLEYLTIETADIKVNDLQKHGRSTGSNSPVVTQTLKRLEVNHIKVQMIDDMVPIPSSHWIFNPIKHCVNLEHWKCPNLPPNDWFSTAKYLTRHLLDAIMFPCLSHYRPKLNIKSLDLSSFSVINYWQGFPQFLNLCAEKGITLLNVRIDSDPQWEEPPFTSGSHRCVASVRVDSARELLEYELPNLEEITVSSFRANWGNVTSPRNRGWPKLNCIRLHLNSSESNTVELIELLLNREVRSGVRTLEIDFEKRMDPLQRNRRVCVTPPYIVEAPSLGNHFPGLTELIIDGWDVDDASFSQIWGGFPLLKVLVIDDCSTAGDLAFIGDNSDEPAFFKLTKLQKLTLNLVHMPKVTDDLFFYVLRHMPLKQFFLYPGNRFLTGITYLLGGKFAASIERFWCEMRSRNTAYEMEMKHRLKLFRSLY